MDKGPASLATLRFLGPQTALVAIGHDVAAARTAAAQPTAVALLELPLDPLSPVPPSPHQEPSPSFRRPRRLPVPCRTRKVATRAILNRASALPSTAGAVATLQSPQHVAKGQCRSLLYSTGPQLGPTVDNPTLRLVGWSSKGFEKSPFFGFLHPSGQMRKLSSARPPGHAAPGSTRHTWETPKFHLWPLCRH